MALFCLLTRVTGPQSFSLLPQSLLRGQTLKTTKNILVRSSALLSNRDSTHFSTAERTTNDKLLKNIKISPLPTLTLSRFASHTGSEPDYKKHSHVMIWRLERVLAAALLPAIPLALVMPSPALDTAVALMIVMHTHWGLEAIVVDYIRPILFGNLVPKIGLGLLYLFSASMLAGLLNLIYNDMGLANCILHLWKH